MKKHLILSYLLRTCSFIYNSVAELRVKSIVSRSDAGCLETEALKYVCIIMCFVFNGITAQFCKCLIINVSCLNREIAYFAFFGAGQTLPKKRKF